MLQNALESIFCHRKACSWFVLVFFRIKFALCLLVVLGCQRGAVLGRVSSAQAQLFILRNMRLVLLVSWLYLALTFAMLILYVLLCLKMLHILEWSSRRYFCRALLIPWILYLVQQTCLPCGRGFLLCMHPNCSSVGIVVDWRGCAPMQIAFLIPYAFAL